MISRDVAKHVEAGGDLAAKARALNEIILLKHGDSGDELTYDDVQNANLMRVVDRRKGLPVALGILYLHAARAQGWDSVGLGFPRTFPHPSGEGPERLILDPFHNGRICDAAGMRELLKAMSGQDVELTPTIMRRCPTAMCCFACRTISNRGCCNPAAPNRRCASCRRCCCWPPTLPGCGTRPGC